MSTSAGTRVSIPPNFLTDDPQWKRQTANWILEANQGHINNVGNVTLLSGTVSTVVSDARAGAFSFIGFMPKTANAAAELGNGTLYVAVQGKQTFTITHANGASGDRTFRYAILG
jgi:hypothetical protein